VQALEWLAPDRVVASPLNVGSGTVTCAHGELPVPAPATAELLLGAPTYAQGPPAELVTPTGALIVTEYAAAYGPAPPMRVERIGYGAGDRNPAGRPNVLRALVGEGTGTGAFERVVVLECQIDDMNPQLYGVLMDRLAAAGALDVFYAPIQMKKNRPGTLVTVVAPPGRREALSDVLFRESTTIGLRVTETDRERLDREAVAVETPIGSVRIKVARRDGAIRNASPEFEDCARLAAERRLSIKEVQAIAVKAWLDGNTETAL
ncbi:MAG: LarC family nickel insertion protein, partial [Acidobacteria bacterium]|nr:LarC family nickel insertion protein [Acidobacteriota bacterium]